MANGENFFGLKSGSTKSLIFAVVGIAKKGVRMQVAISSYKFYRIKREKGKKREILKLFKEKFGYSKKMLQICK